ncbi:MAG TPA: hypothetical protein VGH65_08755 [Verrucomicrobiaceae bacterium]|jgi:hypothetical protein
MRYFTQRRLRNILSLAAAAFGCVALWRLLAMALRPVAVYSGLALLATVVFLAFFNTRKKLPFLPLVKASTWLQIHIYAGWFSVLLFLVHLDFKLPTGSLELILAALFVVVAASGMVGLLLSRMLPPAITRSGEPLVYERIPRFERELRADVESIVERAESETKSTAIGEFYLSVLAPYFHTSAGILMPMRTPDRSMQRVLQRLDHFSRYLDEKEIRFAEKLRACIERKRNLDFQKSAQRVLKLWLFVHIPFTYSLLIVAAVHAWLAVSFAGAL